MRWAVAIAGALLLAGCNPAVGACLEDGTCGSDGASPVGSGGSSAGERATPIAHSGGAGTLADSQFQVRLSTQPSAASMQSSHYHCSVGSPYIEGRGSNP